MIEYNQRWFTKDKEGRGEKELLEEISKNNEKSRPSRAKPDGEGDPEMAKILLSLTKVKGKEATATVMAKLPPSVRGHNCDNFDNEKNEAEEEADGEKNNSSHSMTSNSLQFFALYSSFTYSSNPSNFDLSVPPIES